MTDSQHLPNPPAAPLGAVNTILWIVLVVSLVGNTVASMAGAAIGVHLALGATTLVCIGLLVARRLGRS